MLVWRSKAKQQQKWEGMIKLSRKQNVSVVVDEELESGDGRIIIIVIIIYTICVNLVLLERLIALRINPWGGWILALGAMALNSKEEHIQGDEL